MAATVGTTGFGTLFKMGNGATSETFTAIAEVKSIGGPGLSLDTVDATHMESPSNYREMLPTFLNAGQVTLELNFLPATAAQTVLTTAFAARTKKNFKIVWPNTAGTTWSFSGYITGFSPSASIGDMLSASVTITTSGAVTIS